MKTRGGQVTELRAVRRGQELEELVEVASRRVGVMFVLTFEELDGEWGTLIAGLLA